MKSRHFEHMAATIWVGLCILGLCACAGEPEVKVEPEAPVVVTKVVLPEAPIQKGPFIDDALCREICAKARCNKPERTLKSQGTPTTPRHLEKLLSITPLDHPDRPEFLFNLAELYFERSRYHRALLCGQQEQCAKLEEQGAPLTAQNRCWSEAAQSHNRSRRDMASALQTYQQLLLVHPDFRSIDEVLWYLSVAHEEQGQPGEARFLRERLIKTYPSSPFVPLAVRANAP